MTAYTLIHVDLNDPNSYNPIGLPGAGDSVDGTSISAHGTLSTNEVTHFTLTFGTVSANHANFLRVGNPPAPVARQRRPSMAMSMVRRPSIRTAPWSRKRSMAASTSRAGKSTFPPVCR
jgi:hypothetical protein